MTTETTPDDEFGGDKFRTHQSKDEALKSAALQLRFYENYFNERGESGHAYAAAFHANTCERWSKQ